MPWFSPWIETVLSRVSYHSISPEFRPFSPALPVTWGHSRIGGDCHPRTMCRQLTLAGSPVFSLLLTGGTYHVDSTAPRQDVNSPFTLHVCHPTSKGVCTPRRFGTLADPPPPVAAMPCSILFQVLLLLQVFFLLEG